MTLDLTITVSVLIVIVTAIISLAVKWGAHNEKLKDIEQKEQENNKKDKQEIELIKKELSEFKLTTPRIDGLEKRFDKFENKFESKIEGLNNNQVRILSELSSISADLVLLKRKL